MTDSKDLIEHEAQATDDHAPLSPNAQTVIDMAEAGSETRMPFYEAWDYAMEALESSPFRTEPEEPRQTCVVSLDDLHRNESAIRALADRWFESEGIPFDFSIVRGLADINRRMARELETDGVELEHVDRMPHHLSYKVGLRGLAAMQHRPLKDIDRAVNRRPQSEYRQRVIRQYHAARFGGTYIGIDLETTGDDPLRGYIINTGWVQATLEPGAEPYAERSYYSGLPCYYENRPIPFESVHHITWADVDGHPQFRDDAALQSMVLSVLTRTPYMAHHAIFEHEWFLYCLDGYAEAFKEGQVLPIDTQEICRKLDDAVPQIPLEKRPASLENWARRRGTLHEDEKETHMGQADADLMMRTVIAELDRNGLLDSAAAVETRNAETAHASRPQERTHRRNRTHKGEWSR